MLVTDAGMVIRCPVNDIRIVRNRGSQGVVIFKVGEGERVVSVARLPEESEENGETSTDEPEDSPDSQQADGQQANKGDA
jgi:DNA gyrase subunit A